MAVVHDRPGLIHSPNPISFTDSVQQGSKIGILYIDLTIELSLIIYSLLEHYRIRKPPRSLTDMKEVEASQGVGMTQLTHFSTALWNLLLQRVISIKETPREHQSCPELL